MVQTACCIVQEQKQAALEKVALQAEVRRVVLAKDSEIQSLLADRMRLDAALASITGQVTSPASPACSDSTTSKPSVRASADSQTLRSEQEICFQQSIVLSGRISLQAQSVHNRDKPS